MADVANTRWFSRIDERALADVQRELSHDQNSASIAQALELDAVWTSSIGSVLRSQPGQARPHWEAFLRSWALSSVELSSVEQRAPLERCERFFSEHGVSAEVWVAVCLIVQARLSAQLVEALAGDAARLGPALLALQQRCAELLEIIGQSNQAGRAHVLREAERRAEFATARFQSLAESGMLGVLVCDYAGKILEANDGFLETFGYARADLLAGRVQWLAMTPPEWRHLDERAIEELRLSGKTRPWEKEYFHKDGSRVSVLVGVASLNEAQTIAFVLDVSERKRLESIRTRSIELEAENRRIQEASRLKSEFLANMSHELRTPLNSIIGFTELLHDREIAPDSPHYMEFLGDILRSGRHLQQMINDVLDLAKIEAGKIELRPEAIDVAQLIAEVSAVLRGTAAEKRIRIEAEVQDDAQSATLDPARFKQILYNYLSNALKFTPEDGKVRVSARLEGAEMLCLTVEDTGIGIAAPDIARLFVDFQQLEGGATKKHAGTGLGLALTKRLVESQGGSVGVTSELGKGSRFFALLPLHAPVSGVTIQGVPVGYGLRDDAAAVLVIEDDARDRALLIQTLTRAGYGVQAVATGQQAIAYCSERVYDAITLDLLLPDMTGLDVLHHMRLEGKNQNTPVVVVSVVAERGMMAGFTVQDYLTKPVNGRTLLQTLELAKVPPLKTGKILIVDDDPAARRLMTATLEDLGYAIHASAGGEEALAFAARERPLAVVLDLVMPGVDGLEFLMRFREMDGKRSVPVIVWTMKELSQDDHRKLRRLAQGIVEKSNWRPNSFVEDVRGLISTAATLQSSEVA